MIYGQGNTGLSDEVRLQPFRFKMESGRNQKASWDIEAAQNWLGSKMCKVTDQTNAEALEICLKKMFAS